MRASGLIDQLDTYDDAAFERFCSDLVNAGFSPVAETGQSQWIGPVRPSLRPLTDATRMRIYMYEGWPLRYAHVVVGGLQTEHAGQGTICLWAEDDPAQVAGRDLDALWRRLDEWAEVAQRGFREEDRALDGYLLFEQQNNYQAELPFGDLVRQGSTGLRARLSAVKRGQRAIMIEPKKQGESPQTGDNDEPRLEGAFYLKRNIAVPPRNLDDVRAALTRKQAQDLERGLAARAPVGLAEPSGGYDFLVLAWRRHGREHDAVVVGFENQGASLKASAMSATPNDIAARKRRAGRDVNLLAGKKVVLAGAGSVGGHVALALASSGVGTLHLHDDDFLKTGNLVRHVCTEFFVGYKKTLGVSIVIGQHAPWTTVEQQPELSHDPKKLAAQIEGADLVVDCTGVFSISAALAETCRRSAVPLITGALFHQGALARIQRQAAGDTLIAARNGDPAYLSLPPADATAPASGFLELGCTAPVNNAPPLAVFSAAAEISHAAVDFLTGRCERADERISVFRPMAPPFDRIDVFDSVQPEKTLPT